MALKRITLEELIDNYTSCCELWKLRLAASSIVELGVHPNDWEDVMQEIVLLMLSHKRGRVEGVSEATVLGTRLRSRILNWKRSQARYRNALQRYAELSQPISYTIELLQLCGEKPRQTLARAVRGAVEQLEPPLRKVCWMFMNGLSVSGVAARCGVQRRAIYRKMESIRCRLIAMGVEEILDWRETRRA
jgi:DNA-directed RNA polymerase specialized sigma24 family protein